MSNAPKYPEKLSPKTALLKAASWCAYQERSQHELRMKLVDWGVYGDDAEEVISKLIQEGFVNEERFAKAYAGGKFRIKHWGRQKILQGLKQHNVTTRNIQTAMNEIESESYLNTLEKLAKKKWESLSGQQLLRKHKTTQYLFGKGYEIDLINDVLNRIEEL